MKYFEKTAGAELAELKRIAAAIAKKNKKAIAIADGQEAIARSKAMLTQKSVEFENRKLMDYYK